MAATVIITVILAVAVAAAVRYIIRQKKAGGCIGCDQCNSCGGSGARAQGCSCGAVALPEEEIKKRITTNNGED